MTICVKNPCLDWFNVNFSGEGQIWTKGQGLGLSDSFWHCGVLKGPYHLEKKFIYERYPLPEHRKQV